MSHHSRLPTLNALPTPLFREKLFPPNSILTTTTNTNTTNTLLLPSSISTIPPLSNLPLHPPPLPPPPPRSPLSPSPPSSTTTTSTTSSDPEPEPEPGYELHLHASAELSSEHFAACFALVEKTSCGDYRASSCGWRAVEKKREMRLRDLKYVLLTSAREELEQEGGQDGEGEGEGEEGKEEGGEGKNRVYGFMSFMLTWEDGVEVVYCYEIHLEECVRGKGLGGALMGLLEEVGRRAGVQKAMLTVFKRNVGAVGFYEGLGYGVDEYSPRGKRLRNGVVKEVDYLILSKGLGGKVEEEEHRKEGGKRRRK